MLLMPEMKFIRRKMFAMGGLHRRISQSWSPPARRRPPGHPPGNVTSHLPVPLSNHPASPVCSTTDYQSSAPTPHHADPGRGAKGKSR